MMHRSCCTGSLYGPCSCGQFHYNETNSFNTMYYSMPKSFDEESDVYNVDCTLSLGTPSTRLSSQEDYYSYNNNSRGSSCQDHVTSNGNYMSTTKSCWGLFQSKNSNTGLKSSKSNSNSNDPLLARRCANCDTTSTPLWRNGPRGPKSLCNACGIRFKKEERRATAANNASNNGGSSMEYYNNQNNNSSSWGGHGTTQKMQCYSSPVNGFRFINEDGNGNDRDFLSWRLNVTSGLVHDFTR